MYTDEQVQSVIDLVGRSDFTDAGRLDILKNILKHGALPEVQEDPPGFVQR